MSEKSGEQLHRDIDGDGWIGRGASRLADDAHALGQADHHPRGLFRMDRSRNGSVEMTLANEARQQRLVVGEAGIDARGDFAVEDRKFDGAADHQAAAAALDAPERFRGRKRAALPARSARRS